MQNCQKILESKEAQVEVPLLLSIKPQFFSLRCWILTPVPEIFQHCAGSYQSISQVLCIVSQAGLAGLTPRQQQQGVRNAVDSEDLPAGRTLPMTVEEYQGKTEVDQARLKTVLDVHVETF